MYDAFMMCICMMYVEGDKERTIAVFFGMLIWGSGNKPGNAVGNKACPKQIFGTQQKHISKSKLNNGVVRARFPDETHTSYPFVRLVSHAFHEHERLSVLLSHLSHALMRTRNEYA